MIIVIRTAKAHSILLSALNTSLPILKPTGIVKRGARNFNHDSIKLIEQIKPDHKKVHKIITKNPLIISSFQKVCFCNILF